VTILADLEEFVADHRPHGTLTGAATAPAWNGYLLTVACPCGVVFERWVTPEDADLDLVRAARLNPARPGSARLPGTPPQPRCPCG
jgi:hypothetical protein